MILGVDPGNTTGICILSEELEVMTYGELSLSDQLSNFLKDYIDLMVKEAPHEEDLLVVSESVVTSGRITKGKLSQIKAFDRLEVVCHQEGIQLVTVSPEVRKSIKQVPHVKGNHARDAYRAAVAYLKTTGAIE